MKNTIKLAFTGDVLCVPGTTELVNGDYSILFSEIAKRLQSYDFLVVNPETPFAGAALGYTNARYEFNTPEALLTVLKNNGAKLLSLANNHSMDRGEEGILETLKNCHEAGLDTVGLYASEEDRSTPYVKDFGEFKVAFLNYTYGTNAFSHHRFLTHPYMVNLLQPEETLPGSIPDMHMNDLPAMETETERLYGKEGEEAAEVKPYLARLKKDIETAKKKADYVILLMHSGGQYNAEPDAFTKMIVKKAVAWGVDFIVGNHPHLIQESTMAGEVFVSYSLGNMMYRPDLVRKAPEFSDVDHTFSALLELELSMEDGKLTEKRSFRLLRCILKEGVPVSVDTWDYYGNSGDEEGKKASLAFANRFAGGIRTYDRLQEVYEL